jgi:ribulose bisphosphate carboxylase small subunit
MIDRTDDKLATLGWAWVARDHLGNVAAVTSVEDSDAKEQIMAWLGQGYNVAQLFK